MARSSWCSTARPCAAPVKTGATSGQGVRIEDGLIGGEDLIVNPPAGLKDGDTRAPEGLKPMSEDRHRNQQSDQGVSCATSST